MSNPQHQAPAAAPAGAAPAAAPVAPAGPKPTYKQLSWSLKFEGDAVKVPDIKSEPGKGVEIAGSYDIEINAIHGAPCAAVSTPIPISHVPPNHKIAILIVKVAPASAKDVTTPLTVNQKDAGGAVKFSRELSTESGKPPVVFASVLTDSPPPPTNWTVEVLNENKADITLNVTIAYSAP